jgi:predicted nucleic acid-binding Zn ribbon protein
MITCPRCQSTHNPDKQGFDSKGRQIYECRGCNFKFTEETTRIEPQRPRPVVNCLVCGKETKNSRFCSSSCSATYNNRRQPKRKRINRVCRRCGIPIAHRRTVCDACNPSYVDWTKRTISQLRETAKHQVNAQIQSVARLAYARAKLPLVCRNCGYSKHVEICHIRAINTFSDDTPVAAVNDLANLVALCPNCH